MNAIVGDVAFDGEAKFAPEPVWLADEQIIHINQRMVASAGESHGLADHHLLADALERPKREWEQGDRDVADLAGLLLLEIGKSQPFAEGNKPTALAAANVFLEFNGYSLVAPDLDLLAQLVDGAIDGSIPTDRFLRAIRASAIPTEEWHAYCDSRG